VSAALPAPDIHIAITDIVALLATSLMSSKGRRALDLQFQPERFVYDPEQGLLWFFATEGTVSVESASRWQPWRRWHTSPCRGRTR
jgi:hypothetical protein